MVTTRSSAFLISMKLQKYEHFKLSKESRCASRISGTKEQCVPHSSAGEAAAPAQNYRESNEHWKSWGLTKTKSPKFWWNQNLWECLYISLFSSKIAPFGYRWDGLASRGLCHASLGPRSRLKELTLSCPLTSKCALLYIGSQHHEATTNS